MGLWGKGIAGTLAFFGGFCKGTDLTYPILLFRFHIGAKAAIRGIPQGSVLGLEAADRERAGNYPAHLPQPGDLPRRLEAHGDIAQ